MNAGASSNGLLTHDREVFKVDQKRVSEANRGSAD